MLQRDAFLRRFVRSELPCGRPLPPSVAGAGTISPGFPRPSGSLGSWPCPGGSSGCADATTVATASPVVDTEAVSRGLARASGLIRISTTTNFWARKPCFRAFCDQRALPSGVMGPRNFAPLRRLAAARGCQADVHGDVLEGGGGWRMIRLASLADNRNKINTRL
jgi:hypothetical protein